MARDQKPPGWRRGALGELVAEFLGTAIIILFGTGSVVVDKGDTAIDEPGGATG